MMDELIEAGLAYLNKAKVPYGEIRIEEREDESLDVKNGKTESFSKAQNAGFGARVLLNGAWGFASSNILTEQSIEEAVKKAVEIAKASAKFLKHEVKLAPEQAYQASYKTPVQKDPFTVSPKEKIALLKEATERMRKVRRIELAQGSMNFWRVKKYFGNTDGSRITQELITSGAGIVVTAIGAGEMQKRSYPSSFGGDFSNAGYEFIESLRLLDHAEEIAKEAAALLDAPPCPSGRFDLIIGSAQLALQIHESFGHPSELDRVLGTEISFAGGSFLTLDKRGKFQYGSKLVNITGDATLPGGLGTFGFDDEGVPAQKYPMVKDGIFVNYSTSRETAVAIGEKRSNGTARASGWNRIPLIRMTNISLEPGNATLEDLIADTKDGLFVDINKSWSIDDKRLNFQFGTEFAREVKNGQLGRLLKNPIYTGITPEFWCSCVAIANRDYWCLWGLPNCGKGQPGQVMQVGHGASPAKFANVQVMGTKV